MNLTSTFRRIGEEIYKSYHQYNNKSDSTIENANLKQLVNFNSVEDLNTQNLSNETKDTDACCKFLQNEIPQIRIISCLIILRTLNQGNIINKAIYI